MKIFTKHLLLVSLLLSFSFNSFGLKPDFKHKVQNSPWDSSVYQVKRYLKNTLNDPKSYQSVAWGQVKHTPQGYIVTHQYRAKNAFGGYVVKLQTFYLNFAGDIIKVE